MSFRGKRKPPCVHAVRGCSAVREEGQLAGSEPTGQSWGHVLPKSVYRTISKQPPCGDGWREGSRGGRVRLQGATRGSPSASGRGAWVTTVPALVGVRGRIIQAGHAQDELVKSARFESRVTSERGVFAYLTSKPVRME